MVTVTPLFTGRRFRMPGEGSGADGADVSMLALPQVCSAAFSVGMSGDYNGDRLRIRSPQFAWC